MKTVVKKKLIDQVYEMNENSKLDKDGKLIFIRKPRIDSKKETVGYLDICSFDGDFRYNSRNYVSWGGITLDHQNKINISEDKEVIVEKEIFRADLNELHLITSEEKIIYSNKVEMEDQLIDLMKKFNKQMIESDEKLLAYCKLHKLNIEEVDTDELFKLVYPDNTYKIIDGKLVVEKNKYDTTFQPIYRLNAGDCVIGTINYDGKTSSATATHVHSGITTAINSK